MGGAEEGTGTAMEVDSITTELVTKSTQVAPNTIEAIIETMHPSTLSTIVESEKGTKNFQPGDGIGVTPMVK
jgi:hypothetical protein